MRNGKNIEGKNNCICPILGFGAIEFLENRMEIMSFHIICYFNDPRLCSYITFYNFIFIKFVSSKEKFILGI